MKTVWKYPLLPTDVQTLLVPQGATFLSTEEQAGTIVVYALVDPSAPQVPRMVEIVGTGHDAPTWADKSTFLGTVKQMGGQYMFHVFAR